MNYIVITSIFKPTEAVFKFSKLPNYQLVVVGDKKSPTEWAVDNVAYISVDDQLKIGESLKEVLPYNHYCRKMMGYLWAIKNGAEYIIDTDDDNIPKENWDFPSLTGSFDEIQGEEGYVNIYELFTEQKIWPRGLPLNLITKKFNLQSRITKSDVKIGVWQGLADEDPDVDAIYRLTSDTPCNFNDREPVVLNEGVICPYNSQNTLTVKELFPLLYLPTYVTFRFTDILRGLVAQPIMWKHGYKLGFTKATVVQIRNPHDYMKDFISEIPMFIHGEKVVGLVTEAITGNSVAEDLLLAYKALLANDIVEEKEIVVLEAWLKDLQAFTK